MTPEPSTQFLLGSWDISQPTVHAILCPDLCVWGVALSVPFFKANLVTLKASVSYSTNVQLLYVVMDCGNGKTTRGNVIMKQTTGSSIYLWMNSN